MSPEHVMSVAEKHQQLLEEQGEELKPLIEQQAFENYRQRAQRTGRVWSTQEEKDRDLADAEAVVCARVLTGNNR